MRIPADPGAVAEFSMIRAENTQLGEQARQSFMLTITGAVAIIAYGLNQDDWRVFAVVPFLLLPSALLVQAYVQAQLRAGAYIRAVLEEKYEGFGWESALISAGNLCSRPDTLMKWSVYLGYLGVGLAAVGLAWVYGFPKGNLPRMMLAVESALFVGFFAVSLCLTRSTTRAAMYHDYESEFRNWLSRLQGSDAAPNNEPDDPRGANG